MISISSFEKDTAWPGRKGKAVLNSSTGLREWYEMQSPAPADGASSGIETTQTQKLVPILNVTPADTAWINMAIRMSWMSAALKSGADYDSARVFKAIKKIRQIVSS